MSSRKKINLALQGGGSHGAYTWGALDRLLEEEKLDIEGISGTSAGAMNAAILVNGYMKNERQGAKEELETFWKRISDAAAYGPLHQNPIERAMTGWNLDSSPMYRWMEMMSRAISPYMLNPMNINPLRDILNDMLDVKTLQSCSLIRLFIAATHVTSGHAHVFQCEEIDTDVLLASACIPFMFQAVEIDGEPYWDGGYMGNPAIWPLIYHCQSEDVVLIQINPIENLTHPKSSNEIINRLNEITFNSSLISEMRAIDFVSRLIKDEKLNKDEYKDMHMHLIYCADEMRELNASSKMNTDWDFFLHLKEIGRKAAEDFLKNNWKKIGTESSMDINKTFLQGMHESHRMSKHRFRKKVQA